MAKQIANYFTLYLVVADFQTLPCGWRRLTKYRLTVVNQLSDKLSLRRGEFFKALTKGEFVFL